MNSHKNQYHEEFKGQRYRYYKESIDLLIFLQYKALHDIIKLSPKLKGGWSLFIYSIYSNILIKLT